VTESRGIGESAEIEDSAWYVLGSSLRGLPSRLDQALVTWTVSAADEMLRRVQDEPDFGKASFLVKLKRQLDDAPREVVLLAAELLYLQVLPLSNVRADTKRERIDEVLSWLDPVPTLPTEMADGLSATGVFNGGVGFNVQVWQQLMWLCRFVSSWQRLSEQERQAALTDPWVFRRVGAATPKDWPSIRHSLEYLAWPGWFEPVVASDHRRWIRDAFADRIGGPTGKDDESIARDLHHIRQILDSEAATRIDWYLPPYGDQWWKHKDEGQRAWLVRPRHGGADLVARWQHEGFVSLPASHLGEVAAGSDVGTVRAAVEHGYQHEDYAQRLALTNEYHAFLTRMKTDDLVATLADDRLRIGVIGGEPEYADDEDTRLRRMVAWSSLLVSLGDVPTSMTQLLDQQGTVVDVTAGIDALGKYVRAPLDTDPQPPPENPPPDALPLLAPVTDALAVATFMPRLGLQEIVDLLQERQQIVLFGPPGTGKTYLAKKLSEHIVGADDPSRARLVQFHPSYSYEDFFEGYRPDQTDSGQATFTLQPGPLRDLVGEARKQENNGSPFVLVIDEMNRANIAKVFGELYFLLEYRDESIRLQYRPGEAFRLPRNVFIIATMNTADRSIALVDAAIRRRFAFVEMHPDELPVRDVLATYLAKTGHPGDERMELLRVLNETIEDHDRDFRIGPSYLMRPDAAKPAGLERVWKYDLLPLLEDHYYGRMSRSEVRERFGLTALRRAIAPGAPTVAGHDDGHLDLPIELAGT
jgi:5-methylcytosine-specific restriction protein B